MNEAAVPLTEFEPASPLVSVIVPCYNQGHFLGACIESALAQTYSPVEIVVVDDGSTDDTPEVARRFEGKIVYVRQENSGPAAARNKGVEIAKGEVIGWCDGDDLLYPGCLSRRVAMLLGDPDVGMVVGNIGFVGEDGRDLGIQPEPFEEPFRIGFYDAVTRNWGATCGTVLRKRALVECGLMDPMLLTCEDWELQIRVATKFYLLYDPEPMAAARQVRGSLSRDPILVYDDARKMLRKTRAYADSGWGFFASGQRALFSNVVGFTFFRIRREHRGFGMLSVAVKTVVRRPSMCIYLAAWSCRFAVNRIRTVLGIGKKGSA